MKKINLSKKDILKMMGISVATFLVVSFVVAPLLLFALMSFEDSSYSDGANWECEDEVFLSDYCTLYSDKIESLADHYGLEFTQRKELKENEPVHGGYMTSMTFYLYNDVYTIKLFMKNGSIGYYEGCLFYYDVDGAAVEYDKLRPLVEFLNEFTNYAAYGTITDTNRFEELYYEAKEGKKYPLYASDQIHFDHAIGSVEYCVDLDYYNGYYMGGENIKEKKQCYRFEFEGLLKSLTQ